MKIKKIAAVALVPAAVAGITASSWAAVQAATGHPGAQVRAHQVRHAGQARQGGHRNVRHAAHGSAPDRAVTARPAHSGRDRGGHHTHAKAGHRAHARAAGAPAQQPAAQSPASPFAGMPAFEQCVARRESGDSPTASVAGLFGILPSTWASLGYQGTAGEAPVAMQKAAFDRLYAQYGTSPWAPYDGC